MKHDSHGVNLFEISKKYGFKEEDIVDFSSNINPFGMPKSAKDEVIRRIDDLSTYPDPEYRSLKASIAKYTGACEEDILIGSGTSEIIANYIRYVNPKRAILLSPCYSEYENELRKIGSEIFYYDLEEENDFEIKIESLIDKINENGVELFIFANPNNPTGTILTVSEVEEILKQTKCKVFVDETYVEFADKKVYSQIELTKKYDKVIVARSTSKFFASPGIRLGYATTSDEKCKEYFFKDSLIWGVNIVATIAGEKMFSDNKYQDEVYKFVEEEREYALEFLNGLEGLKVYKSKGNFIMCKLLGSKTAAELYDYLIPQRQVVRNLASFKNLGEEYFRFCILGREDNRKLLLNIEKFLKEQ